MLYESCGLFIRFRKIRRSYLRSTNPRLIHLFTNQSFLLARCWWHLCLHLKDDHLVFERVMSSMFEHKLEGFKVFWLCVALKGSFKSGHPLARLNTTVALAVAMFFWFWQNRQKHKITFSSFRLLLLVHKKSFSDCDLSEPVLLSDYLFINFSVLCRKRKTAIVK